MLFLFGEFLGVFLCFHFLLDYSILYTKLQFLVHVYPRVPSDMPLYDILNEFQKGSSHMAAVVKVKEKNKNPQPMSGGGKYDENKLANGNSELNTPLLNKHDDKSESVFIDVEKASRPITNRQTPEQNGVATNSLLSLSEDMEDGEVIGIITLEDVFEELLQVSALPPLAVDLPDPC